MGRTDASPRPSWAGARARGRAPAGAQQSARHRREHRHGMFVGAGLRPARFGAAARWAGLRPAPTCALPPPQKTSQRRLTTDEHRCAQMNADGVAARIRRALHPSMFIPSDPCLSVSPFLLKGINTHTQVQIRLSPRRKPGPIFQRPVFMGPGFRRGDNGKPNPWGRSHCGAARRSRWQLRATSVPLRLCGSKPRVPTYPRDFPWHHQPASFDKLRMRGNLGGRKKDPHPELVEGRTALIQASHRPTRSVRCPTL
jgi:hypothetical protein